MTLAVSQLPESPTPHRFTRDEFYQMADFGSFRGRRVELIDGEIVDMAAQRELHVAATLLTEAAIRLAFPGRLIRIQMPLSLGQSSDPEPDVSVVAGTPRDYVGTGHPTSALLVVEVADTTLRFDRGKKASLYAAAGIQDYWIVNVVEHCIEVFREPIADATAPLGFRYKSVSTLRPPQSVAPLNCVDINIPVEDSLP